jgi:DNA-binding beta-propeller fold protein YncE
MVRKTNMKKTALFALLVSLLLAWLSGCAFIAGSEETGSSPAPLLKLNFIETLRSEESLRGESYREAVTAVSPLKALQRPGSVYADRFRVYVADMSPARLFLFDRGERTAIVLPTPTPPAEGKLLAPSGIAVDAGGVIVVTDSQQGKVFGYDRNGTLLMVLGRAGDFGLPSGIAIDQTKNRLYIADAHAHAVKVYTNMGTHLFDIGNSGKANEDFKFPVAVTFDRSGALYVLDSLRPRVFVYSAEGAFIRSFRIKGTAPGMSIRPKGIAVDSQGHIYITDTLNNNILVYGNEGRPLFSWGKTGSLFGDFWTPSGIFIDDHDSIYIADQMNGRVQVFQFER